MNYYPHHIGDFDRATRHLTRIERSIYRDLLEVYYDTEQPLTLVQAVLCRKVLARADEEVEAVRTMLLEFFHETPSGWYHDRCEEELEAYRKSNSQKSAAGKASALAKATRRQQAINGETTPVEQPLNERSKSVADPFNGSSTNQEPRTKNQEPETKEVKPIAPSSDEAYSLAIDIDAVFLYWQNQRGHERAKLDDKRKKAIKARLKDGYTIEDLCRAVDGVSKSAHHMGQNEQRTVYDDIELICRNGTNVDKFQKLAAPQQFTDPGLQRQVEILQDWMSKP